MGDELFKSYNFSDALRVFEKVLKFSPEHQGTLTNLEISKTKLREELDDKESRKNFKKRTEQRN